jgi:hypothetical protein
MKKAMKRLLVLVTASLLLVGQAAAFTITDVPAKDIFDQAVIDRDKEQVGDKVTSLTAFTDVPESAYFSKPVTWAVEHGITEGKTTTTFSPYETCSNAHILTFMWRAAGEPEPTIDNPFTNVTGSEYYAKAAVWAVEQGMIPSGSTFAASTPCTRAMAMEYFWKQAGSPATTVTNKFTDVSSSASYAQAVAWAVSKGITDGKTATTFVPNETCSRAHIVTFLYRAIA